MSAMTKVAGAVALALVLFGMSGGADADAATPPEDPYNGEWTPGSETVQDAAGVWVITVWDDNLPRGAAWCEEQRTFYTEPTRCNIQPTSAAPFEQEREWGADGPPGWLS